MYCTDIPYEYAKSILDELCYFNRLQLYEFNKIAQDIFKNSYIEKEVLHFKERNPFSIGDNAFEMCKNLEYIHMPNYIEHIGKSVFKDCDNLYILGYRDSIAEKYAKEYGIRFADIYKDIYNLKEYLSMMKIPREILMETNININKVCKYDIKNVKYDMIGLIINTSKEQYLLDNITHELFMFI